jgi:alpha-methylacyl-CoA racemase
MVDGVASLMSMCHGLQAASLWTDARGANLLDGGAPFYDSYQTADGRYLAVASLEPKFFAVLLEGLGLDAAWRARQYDRRAWPALRQAIAEAVRTRDRDAWAGHFAGLDACVAPVLSMSEATRHPHAVARQAYLDVDGVRQPAPAPRFGRTPPAAPRPPRDTGADSDAVLAEAGFTADEIALLRRSGVVR